MTAYYDDDRYYYLPAIKVVHVHVCCSLHALAWPGLWEYARSMNGLDIWPGLVVSQYY